MVISCHIVIALLFTFPLAVHGQAADFISIDCGKAEYYSFEDTRGIGYTSDATYVDTGENHQISPSINNPMLDTKLKDLRSFPEGKRNCYTLPITMKQNYLIRAYFFYGNYDGLNAPPRFDLYMGTNLWTKVSFPNASSTRVYEMIASAYGKRMSICLVKTGHGKPFISALELRPFSHYWRYFVNSTQSLLTVGAINFGAQSEDKYPEDKYDRIWTPFLPTGAEILSTSRAMIITGPFDVPTEVMQTAATLVTGGSLLNFTWPVDDESRGHLPYYIHQHFAELKSLASDDSRIFGYVENGVKRINNYSPGFLEAESWWNGLPRKYTKLEFLLYAEEGSTLPPIINALEIYQVQFLNESATDTTEVENMLQIKASYNVQKNWMGDPCAPKDLVWDGLGCIYSITPYRIVSLILSGSGLVGTISSSLANLTQLQSLDLSSNSLTGAIPDFLASILNLEFLDLSTNNLTGEIPESLSSLTNLKFLNLTCNGLNESIPMSLKERVDAKLLTLVTGPCLPKPMATTNGDGRGKNKTITTAAMLAGSLLFSLLLVVGLVILWKMCQNQTEEIPRRLDLDPVPPKWNQANEIPRQSDLEPTPSKWNQSDCRRFTYGELVKMTNNFEKELGKGGTSSVFLGHLEDKTPIAVKMLSHHGLSQFADEVEVLKTINHRYLITLIGYCQEKNNLALVYEHLPKGSLADQLSGLAYLHFDCRDTIIHRDIKTTNILLTSNYSARISDFGISKFLLSPGQGQLPTRIVGTPGYVDPEYLHTAEPTPKSDVYGFGVILLELVTGLPAIFRNKKSSPCLIQWVNDNLNIGDLNRIVDPRLKEYNPDSVWTLMGLAMECTRPTSINRPDMRDVVSQLRDCMGLEDNRQGGNHLKHINGNAIDVKQGTFDGFTVEMVSNVSYRSSPR